ncbi:MAG: hypothetical protein A4E57_00470 [Syntrophorhabdaceae bacterium PtaU1.Bin034]|nr:MAG: hypothetical protein A4E57_00470 [Syntrophorhabdaceae bacterium PtaU1.Bin034]
MNRKGFTLVEVIIVIVVLGIVTALAAPLLVQAVRSYTIESDILSADAQGQMAMERMAREIRLIKPADITTFTSGTFAFILDGVPVSYARDGQNRLMRNSDPLASNITSLSFAYFGSD